MTEDTNNEWKKTLFDCKIQGYPLHEYFGNLYTYKNTLDEQWTIGDYENFNKAYSITLTQIEKVKYELDQLDKLKERFEEVFKIKYQEQKSN